MVLSDEKKQMTREMKRQFSKSREIIDEMDEKLLERELDHGKDFCKKIIKDPRFTPQQKQLVKYTEDLITVTETITNDNGSGQKVYVDNNRLILELAQQGVIKNVGEVKDLVRMMNPNAAREERKLKDQKFQQITSVVGALMIFVATAVSGITTYTTADIAVGPLRSFAQYIHFGWLDRSLQTTHTNASIIIAGVVFLISVLLYKILMIKEMSLLGVGRIRFDRKTRELSPKYISSASSGKTKHTSPTVKRIETKKTTRTEYYEPETQRESRRTRRTQRQQRAQSEPRQQSRSRSSLSPPRERIRQPCPAVFVSIDEIKEMPSKQAYKNLLLQTHPDKNSGCPKTAEWKFNLVQKVAKTKGFKASV
jgi:hypothetical protein